MLVEDSNVSFKPELLSLMLRKDFWKKNKYKILKSMFQSPLDKLYESIEAFHDQYAEDLDKSKLWEIIKVDHPALTTAQKSDIAEVVQQIKEVTEWTNEFAEKILTSFWKTEIFTRIAVIGVDGAQGKIKDLEPIKEIIEAHGPNFLPKSTFVEIAADIDELLEMEANLTKWHFNLKPLHERIGGIDPGHFAQLMARPDCGKTAFVISCVVGPGGWAEQGAKIDWYCNEEPLRRTRWRMLSCYTGMTKEQMLQNKDEATSIWNKIKHNVHTFEIPFGTPVEQIMTRTRDRKPDIVIVDQIDKLGVRPLASKFDAETDRIRLLYIKYREIAKLHNCMVVGVCQASASAEGKTIVTYDMAEHSKTGKAAECDLFLGIGRRPLTEGMTEESYQRYITVSKSKLDKNWKGTFTCMLEPEISRYIE